MARRKNSARNRKKKSTQHGGRQQSPAPNQSAVRPENSQPEQLIKTEHDRALTVAQEEGLDRLQLGDEPKPEGADIEALWVMVREARDLFHEARGGYESRNQELDARAAELGEQERSIATRGEELDRREGELAERRTDLDKRDDDASKRQQALADRETDIRQRELNAEAGFIKERQEMLSQLDEARDAFRSEFTEKRLASEARLKEREEALVERDDRNAAERRELANVKRRLEYEAADLEELRTHLDDRAERRAAAIREELEHGIQSLKSQLEQARHDRDRHAEILRQREDADRNFGHRTPDEVLTELDALRAENDKLQAELAERPDAGAAARLADLEREREAWQAERADLTRKVSEYRQRHARVELDKIERESQRDVIESLKSQRKLLHAAHKELQEEVEGLHRRSEARTPFPACMAMDQDSEFQSGQPLETDGLELEAFVEDLQHRIAASQPAPLFYSLPDIRSFVGGLAMGRLILLQGISGTGKTSLPVAFARATGTQAAEIKVQAGWRDPQDLIGHYNTFEKRFHETEFLKALYQAGTPRWRDTVQIVLLDEMNLSHPEQYFSDLLSTLELPVEDQRLELMTHSVAAPPALLDNGGKLRIPPNVWFVGTANHDETTVNFAPKTYDRSHVMEFPDRPQPFEFDMPPPRQPVSFSALQKAFDAAMRKNGDASDEAIKFLDPAIRDRIKNDFDVGWGPRLERQMRRYVPVVVAAGGTVGEATDHMLAMRLLRKLQSRHDNRPQHIRRLREQIRESWPILDNKSEPTKSMALLGTELRRLGQDPENDG